MCRTDADGAWRAVDTMALRTQLGAMAAIVDARVQSALTREFGVRWVAREDGMGHEIAGMAQQTLDAFSTRAHTVTQAQLRLARHGAQRHGGTPNAREMVYLGLAANKISRKGKEEQIDWDSWPPSGMRPSVASWPPSPSRRGCCPVDAGIVSLTGETAEAVMWHAMFAEQVPLAEKILRDHRRLRRADR